MVALARGNSRPVPRERRPTRLALKARNGIGAKHEAQESPSPPCCWDLRDCSERNCSTLGVELFRLAVVFACIVALAAVCVRTAVVAAEAEDNPALARSFWREHPDVLRAEILQGVTQAATHKTRLTLATSEQVQLLAALAPLAPEPFAVTGAMALRSGRYAAAERRLVDARQRDPRFEAARMLLAQTYLAQEKLVPGLKELVALTQISPEVMPVITAALAGYAKTPGAVPRLQRALHGNPAMADALLAYLAGDARNVQLILSLSSGAHGSGDLLRWQQKLLSSLVESGDAANALALWRQFTGRGIPDPGDFSNGAVHSPFTWTLLSSGGGAATSRGRRLDVQFFGEADTSLASTVLVLGPGTYELRFDLIGAASDQEAVHFLITCVPGGGKLLDLPLSAKSGSAARFQVPANCHAQKLQLLGFAQVFPAEVAFSIINLQVQKLG